LKDEFLENSPTYARFDDFFTFDEKIRVKFWSIHALIIAGVYECPKLNPSILADLVTQDFERRVETLNFHIPFYFRYVDDMTIDCDGSSCRGYKIFTIFISSIFFTLDYNSQLK